MVNKKIFLLILLGFLVFALTTGVMAAGGSSLENGKESLNKVKEMYYSEKNTTAEIKTVLNTSKTTFDSMSESYDKFFLLAEIDYFFGLVADREKNKKEAEEKFDNCKILLEKALKLNEKSSEATALLADIYAELMNYKGLTFQIAHGTKLKSLPLKAIELDSKNYQAYVSLGIFYASAPSYAGGSLPKAVENLKIALKSENRSVQFISYCWLAITYEKDKQRQLATQTINKAIEIYPESTWARQILEDIKSK